MAEATVESVESKDDFEKTARGQADRWFSELELADKDREDWLKQVEKITRRYRDDRLTDVHGTRRYNILWSNLETVKPALYSKTPVPQVIRRFLDADPLGRAAAQILERATRSAIQAESFDPAMRAARDDWLLSGMGVNWVRYEPHFETRKDKEYLEDDLLHSAVQAGEDLSYDDDGRAYKEGEEYEEVVFEEVFMDYVPREDFYFSPARSWGEVRWVAKAVKMTKDQLVDRFGDKGKKVSSFEVPAALKGSSVDPDDLKHELFKKATVFEIWDKESKKVCWVAKGHPELLDSKDDPLHLRDFFPCQRPLFATQTPDSLIPIPDYAMYQDQAEELDILTGRINLLLKAVRVAGAYDARYSDEGLGSILSREAENELVPIEDWPSIQEAGGLKGVMDFIPLQPMIEGLRELMQSREIIKKDLYEITGLSDILRGATNPAETATAQEIKGQFASLRLQDSQGEMQRFARDGVALIAEVIAEHFSEETLYLMSGTDMIDDPNPKQYFAEAVKLLRNDALRSFKIDIETDSTLEVNRIEEKKSRVEFTQAFGQMIERTTPMVQAAPELAPVVFEVMTFFARGFKAGRNLESSIEQAIEGFKQKLSQPPPPPPPDPKIEKIKADMAKFQENFKLDTAELEAKKEDWAGKLLIEQEKLELEREKLGLEREKIEFGGGESRGEGSRSTQQSATQGTRSIINISAPPRRKTITLDNGRTGVVEEETLPLDNVQKPTNWKIEGGFYTDEEGNRKIALTKKSANSHNGTEVREVEGGFYTDAEGNRRVQMVETIDDGVNELQENVADLAVSSTGDGLDVQ